MYLTKKTRRGRPHYLLRESFRVDGRYDYRDLFDLGEYPARYIHYPGGSGFYFDADLTGALQNAGVSDIDRELERLMLPFIKPEIRRIIEQMTRPSPKRKVRLSREATAQAQAGLHLFDRRRLYFLRYGRMDPLKSVMAPHKSFNILLGKSRDEIESEFRGLEQILRTREKKMFTYYTLDIARYFPGELSRLFPLGLDQKKLDEAFLTEICRLNRDPDFFGSSLHAKSSESGLSEYLIPYAVYWFDYEFGQRPPQVELFEEFMRRRRFRQPAPQPSMELSKAFSVFSISMEEYKTMNRREITRIYRKLALTSHPDQGGDKEVFIEVQEAYERLIREK